MVSGIEMFFESRVLSFQVSNYNVKILLFYRLSATFHVIVTGMLQERK